MKIRLTMLWVLLSLLSRPDYVGARMEDLKFHHLSVANGLSNSTVNCIMQDSRGLMWFGTSDGLNKYDGYQCTVYKDGADGQNTANSYDVLALAEDRDHDLWIAKKRGGLDFYDRKTDRLINIVPTLDVHRRISSQYVFCVLEDIDGGIWFGTLTGLCHYNRANNTFTEYRADAANPSSLSNEPVHCLFLDSNKRLWVGTGNGLNLWDRDRGCFTRYFLNFSSNLPLDIRSIYEDRQGRLWLSCYLGGLVRFHPDKNEVKRFVSERSTPGSLGTNQLFCIAGDGLDNLYIGTENSGLYLFNMQTEEFRQYLLEIDNETSLNSNSIYSAHIGRDGILWLGTYNGGINYSSKLIQGFRHYKVRQGGLTNPYILGMAEDRYGNLWIGTDGGGLNVLNRKTGQFRNYRHDKNDPHSISANEVTAVFIDSYDQIWVGAYRGGLDLLNPKTGRFTHFRNDPKDSSSLRHNFIHTIYEDSDRNLYIGCFTGLDQFDRKSQTFSRFRYPIIQDGVLSILEDSDGNLWIGTYRGLSFVDKKAYAVVNYVHDFSDENCAVPDVCFAFCEDHDNRMWIGAGKGLFRYDRDLQQFIRYPVSNDRLNGQVTSIVQDRMGHLWLNAGQRILQMPQVGASPAETRYVNFGIYESARSLFLSRNGEIFFGGNYGLNVFSTEDIVQNPYPPPIVLTNLKIFNKEVGIGKKDSPLTAHIAETGLLTLAHEQSVFTFEFASLNYIFPEKNNYAFIMEGFEKEWNQVGTQRSATYTNLDPGEYVFRVRGSNNDGLWNEKGAAIRIRIIPPWWKTTWAFLLYVIAVGSILLGIWRFQLNKARMKHELMLEHLHAEKLEEINRMKSRFFSNVTHEFRTPLTLIIGPIQQILSRDVAGQFKDQCKIIIRNSRKLYQLINQLLDLSKLEAGHMPIHARKENIVDLMKELVVLFMPLAERKNIDLRFDVVGQTLEDHQVIEVYLDQDKLEKIIYNLISNAIKFTPIGGAILLQVQQVLPAGKTGANPNALFDIDHSPTTSRPKGPCTEETAEGAQKFKQGYAEIVVQDNGVGCPAESLDKIFDRFYTVHDSRADQYDGAGIGLALTKELVELHSGDISVKSTPDQGTRFTVRLPLGRDHLQEDEIIQTAATLAAEDSATKPEMEDSRDDNDAALTLPSKSTLAKKLPLLLVVEDHAEFCEYLCQRLSPEFQVLKARNGQEALTAAIEQVPDLIVSDVMMPEMSGFELCRKIKNDERTSHIPVILLTAKASEESKIEGLEIGADDYIIKPFDVKELQVRIRNLIEQRRQMRMRFQRKEGLRPEEIATTSMDEKFLNKVLAVIEQKMSDPDFNVEELAKEIALSRVQLHRKLRSLTGQSTTEFIRVIRLNRAAQLLKNNHESVTQIAFLVGFNSSSYFSRSFHKHFGLSPSEYLATSNN